MRSNGDALCGARHPHTRGRGLTLIELLVVIALAGVLAALAAPSFSQIVRSNRAQAAASEFQAALMLARAEAIKRGADARVAMVANGMTSGTPAAADWKQGVSVFCDESQNANGNTPPTSDTPGTNSTCKPRIFLLKTPALDSGLTVQSNINGISFNGMGRPYNSAGSPGNGTIAIGASGIDWRCIIIATTGRMRVAVVSAASYTSLSSCPSS